MSENNEKKKTEVTKEDCLGCAAVCLIGLSFFAGGPVVGLLLLAIFCVILAIRKRKKNKREELLQDEKKKLLAEIELRTSELVNLRKLFEETDVERVDLQKKLTEANDEIEKLLKVKLTYQGIIDTEEEIKRLRAEANSEIEKQKYDAKWQIDREKADAQRDISLLQDQLTTLKKQKEESEELLTAIRNSIEGYGSQYIKPSYTLLDELADGFGHTEAGAQLKVARKKSILMAKDGSAVECEYPSEIVADKIKSLVLDAFNFKVDSILSQVKKDNYGVLEQKIKDVFSIINNNAKAFHNTYITRKYLNARLGELKWGMVIFELKSQMQEEQRRLKEKMKDEERARKEYEKAVREAEKEEKILRSAMEKARIQVAEATEAQKKEYEDKLAELEAKLKEAEEKGQRALSMAQQTKKGNVYVISNIGSFGENVYKIGMTRRLDPYERVKELGDASVPFPFDVHAIISSDDAPALESVLHKEFALNQVNKVNPRKEFFRVSLTEIKEKTEAMGLDVSWTMLAAATEYHETLVIEKKLDGSLIERENWVKYSRSISTESMV